MTPEHNNPYVDLPETAFWKTAVAAQNPLQISDLWHPKFPIAPKHGVITAGSCFAQHFSRALVARGHNWIDAEPAPELLTDAQAAKFNFGVFSVRTGNIYTARMLRQWLSLAFDTAQVDADIWRTGARFFDPLRPTIEPDGFISEDELLQTREATLEAMRRAVQGADVFVFTMGLTECWRNKKTGFEYAMCPGTVAGEFDPARHEFVNQRYTGIARDMQACFKLLRRANPDLKILLTVSPVPLTATASGAHVLTATSHSKSTLRAVAGDLAADHEFVDYFPSYEIITHPAYRGMFYAPNQRSVIAQGVDHVMSQFFACQHRQFPWLARQARRRANENPKGGEPLAATARAVKCDEEMLNAFG